MPIPVQLFVADRNDAGGTVKAAARRDGLTQPRESRRQASLDDATGDTELSEGIGIASEDARGLPTGTCKAINAVG